MLMPVKIFLDTNIIIYSYSLDEPEKKQKASNAFNQGNLGLVLKY